MSGSVQNRLRTFKAQRALPLCLYGVLGFVVAFSVQPVSARAQSNDIQNRLQRIENDVQTLNRAVYKGEMPSAPSGGAAAGDANMEVRMTQIETEIRNITGKIEQLTYDNEQLQQRLDALSQDSKTRLDTLEGRQGGTAPAATTGLPAHSAATDAALTNTPTPPADPNAPATAADPNLPAVLQPPVADTNNAGLITGSETGAVDAAGLYEQGFAQIKAQDYPAAEKSFADFMKKYPDHSLAPNALYWLGETFYARKQYDQAAVKFAEAYKKYPNGPKGADNLLKLGLSLAGKGQKDNACIALGQLKKEYPKGPAPVLARGAEEMKTLGCP